MAHSERGADRADQTGFWPKLALTRAVSEAGAPGPDSRYGALGPSEKWCARQDSNLRPTAPEAVALSS